MRLFDGFAHFLISLGLSPGAVFAAAFAAWLLLGAALSALIGGLVHLVFACAHSKTWT